MEISQIDPQLFDRSSEPDIDSCLDAESFSEPESWQLQDFADIVPYEHTALDIESDLATAYAR
ncbi:MAG: hypothetical protein ACFCVA_16385 [Gammaproteobacteria bacterium]